MCDESFVDFSPHVAQIFEGACKGKWGGGDVALILTIEAFTSFYLLITHVPKCKEIQILRFHHPVPLGLEGLKYRALFELRPK